MEDIGFIITRNVINKRTNLYWNECYNCIRKHYDNKIIIICDNSRKEYIQKINNKFINVQVIESEYPKRGEFLAYYYLYKYKFFKKAIIIHDSSFIQNKLNIDNIDKIKFFFNFQHIKNTEYLIQFIKKLKNNYELLQILPHTTKWLNCFGLQSIINYEFLKLIYEKYNFDIFLDIIKGREQRIHMERIFGLICSYESKNINSLTLFNKEIFNYQPKAFHYRLHNYYEDNNKNNLDIIKVWTGR